VEGSKTCFYTSFFIPRNITNQLLYSTLKAFYFFSFFFVLNVK